jgi:hypothetical protein
VELFSACVWGVGFVYCRGKNTRSSGYRTSSSLRSHVTLEVGSGAFWGLCLGCRVCVLLLNQLEVGTGGIIGLCLDFSLGIYLVNLFLCFGLLCLGFCTVSGQSLFSLDHPFDSYYFNQLPSVFDLRSCVI